MPLVVVAKGDNWLASPEKIGILESVVKTAYAKYGSVACEASSTNNRSAWMLCMCICGYIYVYFAGRKWHFFLLRCDSRAGKS